MPRLLEPSYETVTSLCEDRANESRSLEFKEIQPGKSDKDKFELAKDVTAFANGQGGTIIFGIREADGVATQLSPITDESSDALIRRLGQVLDALVEPRFADIQMYPIDLPEGGYVLMIQVIASFERPHRIKQGSKSRFVIREEAYVRDMTIGELRSSFRGLDKANSEFERFREDRAGNVERGIGPTRIDAQIQCLVHTMPLAAWNDSSVFSLDSVEERWPKLMGQGWGGASHSFNFDGLIVYCTGSSAEEMFEYKQVYRSGLVEACIRACSDLDQYKHIVPALALCKSIKGAINSARAEYIHQKIGGGLMVMVSLIGTDGKALGLGGRFPETSRRTADRNTLLVPSVLIRDLQSDDRTENALKFVFDVIWQSFGWSGCTYYDANGKWSAPSH